MDWMKHLAPKPGEENYKIPTLSQAMDILSERRLKFTNYLSGFVARKQLGPTDEALAEAYLSGLDDANRILRYLNGEGPDINALDFWQKAKIAKPDDYGIKNMSKKEINKLGLTGMTESDTVEEAQQELPDNKQS